MKSWLPGFLGGVLFGAVVIAVTYTPQLKAQDINATGSNYQPGCQAANAEQPAGTNWTSIWSVCDLVGKVIVMPYANKELFLAGENTQTSTTATTLIAAQGAGVKIYVTAIQCGNTGATTSMISLNNTEADAHSWSQINPAGGGFGHVFSTPLVIAANTALQFTPASASSTQTCNVQGYSGS